VLVHCLAGRCKSLAIPASVKVIVLGIFCGCNSKTSTVVISEPDEVHNRSRAAIQQPTAPIATNKFVLATHYDVSIKSRLADNQQPHFVQIF